MVTMLIIAIPVTSIVTGFFVLKSVQIGLRWQMEIKQEQKPTLEIKNPITEKKAERQHQEQVKEMQNVLDEYLNGARE